ncbi:MAG: UDP-3-O-(3-hydroxymyristoyl)glucosamine N-acyltransferase [Chitinophagaceae bacterium]|nr:UDP-3-O-(3-hydroxymyristoyl)glucosamine N-acyltransferase [Chitinophagaceae bacterium]
MQFPSPVSAQWLSEFINAKIEGNADAMATGINEIHRVQKGDIVFVDHPKYYDKCINSEATFIIINQSYKVPEGKTLLVCDEPFEAYQKITKHFRPFSPSMEMISTSASIHETAVIMPNVYIGNNVKIGEDAVIHPNVTIYDNVTIGKHVEIHSGTVIGGDAFYYNTKKNRDVWYKKMHTCGEVLIEDYVEIGANCTIDRGVSAVTKIGQGTKIDNLVQIGHDVIVGKNCLFASQVGIAGGCTIGDGVTMWGQVGISKTLNIGDNVMVMGKSGVATDLKAGNTYFGSPAIDFTAKRREYVMLKRLPEIWEAVRKIQSTDGGR